MVLVADRHRDRIGRLGLTSSRKRGFLPVEVEAMINGWVWKFLLDEPNLSSAFNRRNLSAHGSAARSAWLTEPFLRATSGVESNPAPHSNWRNRRWIISAGRWIGNWLNWLAGSQRAVLMEWDSPSINILPGQVGGWMPLYRSQCVHPHRLSALSDRSVAMGWANSRYRHSRSSVCVAGTGNRTISRED